MQRSSLVHHPVVYALLLTLLLLAGMGTVSAAARGSTAKAMVKGTTKSALQGREFLPVFQFSTPQISDTDTFQLAQRFENIYMRQPVQQDVYLNNTRYTVANTETNSILEQYGATGGFYAYNVTDAFSTTTVGSISEGDAESLACQYLLQNELFPQNVEVPDHQSCDFNPETFDFAEVSLAHATGLTGPGGPPISRGVTETIIAAIVRVPMSINTAQYDSFVSSVPLGGAGGHLSLLFRTTDSKADVPSLDQSVPGLGAVALPFYGREFQFYGNYPAVDPVSATAQMEEWVQESFPGLEEITMAEPQLMYMVDDAAVPQRALEPQLVFQGIEVMVDGETIILKEMGVPGVKGFGPEVTITEPEVNNSVVPGEMVSFTASIVSGTAPYTFSWELDDETVLMTGTLEMSGTTSFATDNLPFQAHNGVTGPVLIRLKVEDAIGAQRQAYMYVHPTGLPYMYMPQVIRAGAGVQNASSVAARPNPIRAAMAPAAPTANYSFGTEEASDYPPYGPGGSDLGGVPGDVSGFRGGMQSLGWDRRFSWANSLAWEKDWRDCSLGGGDCSYGVDRTDFVFFSGHGGPGGISMPSNVDSGWFAGTNARFQNARWVAFSSCQTLRAQWTPASAAPIRDWFNAFQGAHMLLGFNSNMADIHFGGRFVDNMRLPSFSLPFIGTIEMPWAQRTIANAWTQTAFELNAGQPAYLFAVGTNGVNPELEKLPKANDPLRPRPFPVASYNWVWWDE